MNSILQLQQIKANAKSGGCFSVDANNDLSCYAGMVTDRHSRIAPVSYVERDGAPHTGSLLAAARRAVAAYNAAVYRGAK